MSVQTQLSEALVAALRGEPEIAGAATAVFDAAPVRAARPYAMVEEVLLTDWSTKDLAGREGRIAVILRDAGERPVRLRGLSDAVDAAVEGLPRELPGGWRIASLVAVRSRIVREGDGLWSAMHEYRVRLLRMQ